jgi:hypothetical protein
VGVPFLLFITAFGRASGKNELELAHAVFCSNTKYDIPTIYPINIPHLAKLLCRPYPKELHCQFF